MRITPPPLSAPFHVLVAEDDAATRMLVVKWLARAGLLTVEARDGDEAVEVGKRHADVLDAVVCDVMMPGRDGYAVIGELRRDPRTADLPILILTAHAVSEAEVVRGVEAGAVDHMSKPFSGPVFVAKVKRLCERARAEKELRRKLLRAEETATIDPLTNLPNRRALDKRLTEEIAHARRHGKPLSVAMIDLDHFKSVNDTFGHEEGDRVLVHLANVVRSSLRAADAAFRHGGEEFVLLLREAALDAGVQAVDRVRLALRASPIDLGPQHVERIITMSAGVASTEGRADFSGHELLASADGALYEAKRSGRDRVCAARP